MSSPVNFEDPADIKWKWRAENAQQYYCDALSDRTWELYEPKEYIYVAKKVAFATFGLPKDENIDEKGLEGYEPKQREFANKIKDKIIENKPKDMDLHISFMFICCKMGDTEFPEPIFRVLRETTPDGVDTASYIDTCGRTYTDWKHFLEKNLLPECIFCYPEQGYYDYDETGAVRLAFAQSPACALSQKVRRYGDTVGTTLSFAAAGVAVAALFTPVAPVVALGSLGVGGVSGIYATFRGVETVCDRKAHGQSNSVLDPEARGVWLNIAATALGTIAGAANAALLASAKAGEVFSKSARVAINVLNISTVSVNGVVIADRLVYMVDRYKNGKLTTLDILQFSTSVFFFTNSLISIKMARTMIKDAQAEVINSHQETLSPNELPEFKGTVKQARNSARSTMYGNGRVIKRITMLDTNKISPTTATRPLNLAGDGNEDEKKATLSLSPTGVVGGLIPNPTAAAVTPITPTQSGTLRMFQVFSGDILKGAGNYVYSELINDPERFVRTLDQLCNTPGIGLFRANIETFLDNIQRAFKSRPWTELEINGVKIFSFLHPFEQDRLGSIMGSVDNNFNPDITDVAINLSNRERFHNPIDFGRSIEHVTEFFRDKHPSPQSLKELKNPKSNSFKELVESFEANESAEYTLPYYFTRYTDETRELSQFEEHLKICRELFGDDVNSNNAILSEISENTVSVTYLDANNTVYTVIINNIPQDNDITLFIATVSTLRD